MFSSCEQLCFAFAQDICTCIILKQGNCTPCMFQVQLPAPPSRTRIQIVGCERSFPANSLGELLSKQVCIGLIRVSPNLLTSGLALKKKVHFTSCSSPRGYNAHWPAVPPPPRPISGCLILGAHNLVCPASFANYQKLEYNPLVHHGATVWELLG